MKILLVDDTESNIDILLELLSSEHEISVAMDGQTALEYVRNEQPDIILLDVMMPQMDGWEVIRRLKAEQNYREIPIIFITSKEQVEDEIHGFELGAVDYITKPFVPVIVKSRVNTHLELKRQRDILANLSMIDGLTGISNRRRFDEALHKEWTRGARSNFPVSLILMDIDFFKPYNDNYGHPAGDECLRKVGQALAREIQRAPDLVARYGGEEFVSLLPETDHQGAQIVAEKLRTIVERLAIPHAHSRAADHVTLSLGMVTAFPSRDQSPLILVQGADELLYQSKQAGRNRLTCRNMIVS
ncbi:MAG: diguanylate cyclase [Magnetococcales bacterium]|nr:diguanylate cyclase [Magnetococcales bacterium]